MSRFVLTAQLQLQAPNNVRQVVQQIQSQLSGVSVNVQVQGSAQAQRQLQQVTQQANQATTAAERMGRAFSLSVRRFAAFSVATRAVSLFTSTLGNAVQDAIDFERQLIKVGQVTGKTVGQLRGLTKQINSLSSGLGVSSADLLEVSTVLAQAGLSAEDTSVALRTLAKAALAPNFDSISETAEGAIAILAQFQEGVGALEKQLGSINAVAGAFAVEASDLIDVVRRTGGVFKASGGSLNELLALFTSVRATTRESAESIGTGLRTIFTRIQRPKTIEFLKQFGVELVDLNGKFVGPFEAIKRLSEALSGLGEGDLTFISIAEELGGFRQIGKVLPLLQQFSTAQSALNVAMKAGDSLTQDAASAQAALAIRIMKVKEEFLALIRSMTETSTFQIMANTALSLASALIKIADSIKPLLPMLAALAAFRIAKGMGSFFGGIMSGATSGRTYNKGGKVLGFARGGLVPGSGNRDTVPAMLSPGEFVIRKSSVNKMGAGTLAAMNENRYAKGTKNRGIKPLTADSLRGTQPILPNPLAAKGTKKNKGDAGSTGSFKAIFDVNPNEIGAFVLQPGKGSDGFYTPSAPTQFILPPNNKYSQFFAKSVGLKPQDLGTGVQAELSPASYPTFYPGKNDLQTSQYSNVVRNATQKGLKLSLTNVVNQVNRQKLLDVDPTIRSDKSLLSSAVSNVSQDQNLLSTIDGYIFEGMITALTGAKAAGNKSNFDFPASAISRNKDKLQALFGNNPLMGNLRKAEAKRNIDEVRGGIQSKVVNEIKANKKAGVRLRKMATGGGVGTDTVPALLTPGEFVVNRSSAQRIGYGNLNRMNKVGKYAKGGVVQHFATGTSGTGAKPAFDLPAEKLVLGGLNKLERSALTVALGLDKITFGSFTKLTMGAEAIAKRFVGGENTTQKYQKQMTYLESVLPSFSKVIERNAQLNKRNALVNADVVDSLYHLIKEVDQSGASQQEVRRAAIKYSNALAKNSRDIEAGVPVVNPKKSSSSTPTATPSSAQPSSGFATMSGTMGTKAGGVNANTAAVNANTKAQNSAAKSAMGVVAGNKMMVASMGVSIIQGFLPALDESSSGALKMTHSILGLITTITAVGFALETFGLQLKMQNISGLFQGKLGGIATKAGNVAGAMSGFGGSTMMGTAISGVVSSLTAIAIPAAAAAATFYIVKTAGDSLVEAIYGYEAKLKKAIEEGNVEKARTIATDQQAAKSNVSIGAGAAGGAVAGAIIGSAIPVVGTAIGAAVGAVLGGLTAYVASDLPEYAGAVAASQAAQVDVQNKLTKATEESSAALEEYNKGAKTGAEVLKTFNASTAAVAKQRAEANKLTATAEQNKSNPVNNALAGAAGGAVVGAAIGSVVPVLGTAIGAALGAAAGGIGGYIQSNSRNARIDAEAKGAQQELSKSEQKAVQAATPALNALGRDVALAGGSVTDFMDRIKATDPNLYDILIRQGTDQLNKSFENIAKEVERSKKAFEALNLGLRAPVATATAASSALSNFTANLEVGSTPVVQAVSTLEAAFSEAGQAMDPKVVGSAINDVASTLEEFGASDTSVTKFRENAAAFAAVSANYNEIFKGVKEDFTKADFRDLNAEGFKDKFASNLDEQLKNAGIGDEARKRMGDVVKNIKLDDEDMKKLRGGDLSVFQKYLDEAGNKTLEEAKKVAEETAKVNQQLIGLTKQRIEAERNLVQAQQEAIDLFMEGREVQGKYGGRAVTTQERRGALLQRSNVEATRLGLSAMRTGDVGELRRRNAEIRGRFSGIESQRTSEGGMRGVGGVEADATQQDLQKAYKTQIDTIRGLIKLEEEQLKITEEKNKLERDSMESLVKGDVEAFFKQQAAVGATAAIASGDQRLMNQYGAEALGTAALDIKRQQDAGVQTLFGQQLAGPGGLTEAAAGAALASRGVTDTRAAQVMAGTTAEEEASKARLRELGGMLGETGQLGTEMAEMQVQTATVNINTANLKLEEIKERGRKVAAEAERIEGSPAVAKARGGLIYANRGIFVPRGTDTVPAMLTPGEFVVNRGAVQRGNNLQILRAMNGGAGVSNSDGGAAMMARGGMVRYRQEGSSSPEAPSQGMTNFVTALENFNRVLSENVQSLRDTKISIKLDSTSVSINLNDGGLLKALTGQVKQELFGLIENQFKVVDGGRLKRTDGGII